MKNTKDPSGPNRPNNPELDPGINSEPGNTEPKSGSASFTTLPKGEFKSNLLKGSIVKNIITLSLPVVLANFIANAYYIIDMIFVGRLGPSALAAVSLGGILMSFTWTLLVGVAIGTSSFIARSYGQKDEDLVNKIVVQTIYLIFFIAGLLFLFGMTGVEYCIGLLGAEKDVFELAVTYTKIVLSGAFFIIAMLVFNSMFRGTGDTKTPLYTLGISSIINILLDPILIFGIGPIPAMGVKGAAIATLIGQSVGVAIAVYILLGGRSRLKVTHWNFKLDRPILTSIMKVAIPGSMQLFIQSISGLVIMKFIAAYGTNYVAAFGIGMRLDLMAMLPGWALGAGISTILGQNLGANKPLRAEKTGWYGGLIYLVVLTVVSASLFFGSDHVIKIFNSDPEVIAIGTGFINYMVVGYLFLSFALTLTMAMNGAGYTIAPLIIIIVAHFGYRIPGAYFFSEVLNWGVEGVWFAIASSIFIQAVLVTIWFKIGKWKKHVIHTTR